jgi:hypothetical protein
MQIRFSQSCLMEDVTLHSTADMCFRVTGSDFVTFRRCRIAYPPGSDRLVVSLSDGMHVKNARHGPLIEDCVFEGLMDDSNNISTMSEDLVQRIDDTTFRTMYSDIAWYPSSVREGDVLQAWDPVEGRPLGEMTVTKVTFLSSHERIIEVDRPVDGLRARVDVGRESNTWLFVKKRTPAVIRRCRYGTQLKTACVLRDPAQVSHCVFEDTAYGIHGHNSPIWAEGPWPQWLLVDDCRFAQVEVGAIVLLALGRGSIDPVPTDVRIRGCRIRTSVGDGIHLTNLSGVRIEDTTIEMGPGAPEEYQALDLVNCERVDLDELRVIDPRP